MSGQPTCPNCGRAVSPDDAYCPYCGFPLRGQQEGTQVMFSPSVPREQQEGQQQPPPPPPPTPGATGETQAQPAVQQAQPTVSPPIFRPPMPAVGTAPVVYQLVFPDGKFISVVGEPLKVFGREDFTGYVPEEYLRLITRREKGGQFMIYCQAKEVGNVECYIRDDFSTNPTLVNGTNIKGRGWVKLKDGDVISPAGVVNIWFRLRA